MFTEEDILEIYRFCPPGKQVRPEQPEALPVLIETVSGRGFVTERNVFRSFEHIVTARTTRIPISAISSELDVGIDALIQLVHANPTLALLSQDELSIVPQQERDMIAKDLRNALDKELVTKMDFVQSHNIPQKSLDGLLQASNIDETLAENAEDYLLSKAYEATLFDAISKILKEGRDGVDTIELRPESLPGIPPAWLLRRCLARFDSASADGVDVISQFHIEEENDLVRCIPKRKIQNIRDEIVDILRSGKVFCLHRRRFARRFREVYQSSEETDKHLSGFLNIIFMGDFAVSTERLGMAAMEGVRELECNGYVNLMAIIVEYEVPQPIENEVQDRIAQIISTTCSSKDIHVQNVGNFIYTTAAADSKRALLLGLAKTQASHQWDLLKDTPDKDPKFQMAEVIATIPDDDELMRLLSHQKESEAAASEQFWNVISDLESRNEAEFSTFWTEKVSLRVHNYHEGLKSVKDQKLHEQLAELLSAFLQKELMIDMVSKARSQGLARSRRTRKNLQRFEATLKTTKSDLTSVSSTLDKFAKKQGLPEIEPVAAEEAKKALIQDMVRRMQKPKTDAPLMFLSLVVILFAKHYSGIVYATGKFAPKLLKQLKTKLDGEVYEQVEKWKELAKAGTLAKGDREAMVHMAEQALPQS